MSGRLSTDLVHEIRIPFIHPKMDIKDLQTNNMLLDDKQITALKGSSVIEVLEGRITKRELNKIFAAKIASGELEPFLFSVQKSGDVLRAVYKGNTHSLGSGGFGSVKLLQDLNSGETSEVLKVIKEGKQKQIQREKEGLEKLQQFSALHERPEKKNKQFEITMSLAKGSTLNELFERKLPAVVWLDMMMGVLKEVKALHEKGILHCDLKPDNIHYDLVTRKATLIDLGLAEFVDTPENLRKGVNAGTKGTPNYMSADALKGTASEKSEIYSLAMTFAKILGMREERFNDIKNSLKSYAIMEYDNSYNPAIRDDYTRQAVLKILQEMADPANNFSLQSIPGHTNLLETVSQVRDEYIDILGLTNDIACVNIDVYLQASGSDKTAMLSHLKNVHEIWLIDEDGSNQKSYLKVRHELTARGLSVGNFVIQSAAGDIEKTLQQYAEQREESDKNIYECKYLTPLGNLLPLSVTLKDSQIDKIIKSLRDEVDEISAMNGIDDERIEMISKVISTLQTAGAESLETVMRELNQLQTAMLATPESKQRIKAIIREIEEDVGYSSGTHLKVKSKGFENARRIKSVVKILDASSQSSHEKSVEDEAFWKSALPDLSSLITSKGRLLQAVQHIPAPLFDEFWQSIQPEIEYLGLNFKTIVELYLSVDETNQEKITPLLEWQFVEDEADILYALDSVAKKYWPQIMANSYIKSINFSDETVNAIVSRFKSRDALNEMLPLLMDNVNDISTFNNIMRTAGSEITNPRLLDTAARLSVKAGSAQQLIETVNLLLPAQQIELVARLSDTFSYLVPNVSEFNATISNFSPEVQQYIQNNPVKFVSVISNESDLQNFMQKLKPEEWKVALQQLENKYYNFTPDGLGNLLKTLNDAGQMTQNVEAVSKFIQTKAQFILALQSVEPVAQPLLIPMLKSNFSKLVTSVEDYKEILQMFTPEIAEQIFASVKGDIFMMDRSISGIVDFAESTSLTTDQTQYLVMRLVNMKRGFTDRDFEKVTKLLGKSILADSDLQILMEKSEGEKQIFSLLENFPGQQEMILQNVKYPSPDDDAPALSEQPQPATTEAADILVLEENTAGHDIVIGDVHGEITVLANLVKNLGPNDRLFIVGDLVDRGEDSLGVLNFINGYNLERGERQIFTAKGNHEVMLDDFIKTQINSSASSSERKKAKDLHRLNGGKWTTDLSPAQLAELHRQIQDLPYVIHVKGGRPFNIAHADIPFNDADLVAKIAKKDFALTDQQKEYCVWARTKGRGHIDIKDTGRNADSIPTYCGHSILEGMRNDTNHVNLDFGSFDTHHIGVMNHTTNHCVTYTSSPEFDPEAITIQQAININLQRNPVSPLQTQADRFADNAAGLSKAPVAGLIENANSWQELSFQFDSLTKKLALEPAQVDSILKKLTAKLPPFSGDLQTLKKALPLFDDKSRLEILANLQKVNYNISDLMETLKELSIAERTALIRHAASSLPTMVHDNQQFIALLSLLPETSQTLALQAFGNNIKTLFKTVEPLVEFMRAATPAAQIALLNTLSPVLPMMMYKRDFQNLAAMLPAEVRQPFINDMTKMQVASHQKNKVDPAEYEFFGKENSQRLLAVLAARIEPAPAQEDKTSASSAGIFQKLQISASVVADKEFHSEKQTTELDKNNSQEEKQAETNSLTRIQPAESDVVKLRK
jgi:serine/threonine protein kinase